MHARASYACELVTTRFFRDLRVTVASETTGTRRAIGGVMRSTSIVGAFVSLVLLACGGGSPGPSASDDPPVGSSPGSESPEGPAPSAPSRIGIASPDAVVVRAGQSATFEIVAARPADTSGPMTIEILDLPPGVVAHVTAAAKDTWNVELETTAESPLGDHHLRVRASAGDVRGEALAPIVIAGAPGTLDTSFAGSGIGLAHKNDFGHAVTTDRQGRALVAGLRHGAEEVHAKLTRFLPNGAVDMSFGQDGALSDIFADAWMSIAYTTALLDDGAILVSGGIITASNEQKSCFVKLDATGKRVPSFGVAGQVCAPASMSMPIRQLVVGADGNMFAAGTTTDADPDMSVLKVTKDGVLDTSFGAGGRVTFTSPGDQETVGIAFDSKGRLVVGGNCSVDKMACAWRLDTNGKVDMTFADGLAKGLVGMIGMDARAMALGPKDEVYLAGATLTSQMAVVAFDADGSSLSTFGSGGWISFALTPKDALFTAAWDDGKLLLAGAGQDAEAADGAESQVLALRVGADGQLDASYAKFGFVLHPVTGEANAVSLSPGRATFLANRKDGMQLTRVWR